MDLRSPLSRARGLGSSREGAHHWLLQRLSAIALIPLTIWFVVTVLRFVGGEPIASILSAPLSMVGFILFLTVALYHAGLGMKVVIEDYVHCPCGKTGLIIALQLAVAASIAAIIFTMTVFYISLGSSV